jgi:hypothetical protein
MMMKWIILETQLLNLSDGSRLISPWEMTTHPKMICLQVKDSKVIWELRHVNL